jgi:hypothetical protein
LRKKQKNRHEKSEWTTTRQSWKSIQKNQLSMKCKKYYGEPDVVSQKKQTNFFYDCATESPRDEEAIVMTKH